jgi:YggT family protein
MLLALLLDVYTMVVFAAVVVSWLNLDPEHPIARVTRAATEPVLGPIRKILPDMGGIDLSPMVLLFGIQLLRRVLFH